MNHRHEGRRSSGLAADLAVPPGGISAKIGKRSSPTALLARKYAAGSSSIGPALQKLRPGSLAGCIRGGHKMVSVFDDHICPRLNIDCHRQCLHATVALIYVSFVIKLSESPPGRNKVDSLLPAPSKFK